MSESPQNPGCCTGLPDPSLAAKVDRQSAFHSITQSVCPTCRALIQAKILFRDGKVILSKRCLQHGLFEALLSSDIEYWTGSLSYTKPGTMPHQWSTPINQGCPQDCGLCPDHEQHTCVPIIEITNHCDLRCPICIVWNRQNYHMPVQDFRALIDGLKRKEGSLELALLSGGEPTLHPQFFELAEYALRQGGLKRLLVSSHGLRLCEDEAFARRFKELGLYLSLQFDSLRDDRLRTLRGVGLLDRKLAVLEVCERLAIPTVLVPTVVRGVNEDEVGALVEFAFRHDFITSVTFQPAAFTGEGGTAFPHDPLSRITQVDMHRLLAEQTDWLKPEDFLPIPCSHPSCYSTCYVLKSQAGTLTPLTRLGDLAAFLDALTNRGILVADASSQRLIQDAIYRLWSAQNITADTEAVIASLKSLFTELDKARSDGDRLKTTERKVKAIYIHAFMDEYDWELSRIRKCCNHYALPDGRLIPGCAYNAIHRFKDQRLGLAQVAVPARARLK
jgi:7,8-dihydro-6-hydroxymethylpterin dimethyltransferase